jgi:hypothetical protein
MTDSSLRLVHHLWGIANGVRCDDNRLGCESGCEESMSVANGVVSGSVCAASGRAGRAGHNCQSRTTWLQQLAGCSRTSGGERDGKSDGWLRVRWCCVGVRG